MRPGKDSGPSGPTSACPRKAVDMAPDDRETGAQNAHQLRRKGLKQFLAGYFHQDFDLEGDADAVIKRYIEDAAAETLREVLEEIRELLGRSLDEASLEKLFTLKLFCAYDPTVDGWTYASWLSHVEETIAGSWESKRGRS